MTPSQIGEGMRLLQQRSSVISEYERLIGGYVANCNSYPGREGAHSFTIQLSKCDGQILALKICEMWANKIEVLDNKLRELGVTELSPITPLGPTGTEG